MHTATATATAYATTLYSRNILLVFIPFRKCNGRFEMIFKSYISSHTFRFVTYGFESVFISLLVIVVVVQLAVQRSCVTRICIALHQRLFY